MKVQYKAPFYPQSWDTMQWRDLGFESEENAKYWKHACCGILCLKMAIDGFLQEQGKQHSAPLSTYAKRGVEIGAYSDSIGWSHDGLAKLAQRFGFTAQALEGVSVEKLCEALEDGFLSVVSIKVNFEVKKSLKEKMLFWKKFGGHLALVVGLEKEGKDLKGFYVHHTSIHPEWNGSYLFVPLKRFKQGFTGRCVLVKPA